MPGSALWVAVVRKVTAWEASGEGPPSSHWGGALRRRGLVALCVWAMVAVAVRGWLAHQLGLPHPAGVSEVLIAGGGWALLSIERGLLQSKQAYGRLARNLFVEAGVRTALPAGLVAAGPGDQRAAGSPCAPH